MAETKEPETTNIGEVKVKCVDTKGHELTEQEMMDRFPVLLRPIDPKRNRTSVIGR